MALKKLEWVEVMRGLAACWVLAHHAGQSIQYFVGGRTPRFLLNGYLGVDFFFVLSGFIIALSCDRLLARDGRFVDYAQARLIRIYVPYLPVGIGMLALYWLFPGVSASGRSVSVVSSLTLLPAALPPALSVAWSLVHEMIFYALFALVFVSRRWFAVAIIVWSVLLVGLYVSGVVLPRFAGYFLSPINLGFVAGVAFYHLTASRQISGGLGFVALALGAVIVVTQVTAEIPHRLLLVAGFVCLLAAASSEAAQRVRPGAALVALGAASYAIYLVHNPILSALARVIPVAAPLAAFAVLVPAALAAGLAYHFLYERPALRIVKGWLK